MSRGAASSSLFTSASSIMNTVDLTGDDEDDSPAKRLKTSPEEKAPKKDEPVSEEILA